MSNIEHQPLVSSNYKEHKILKQRVHIKNNNNQSVKAKEFYLLLFSIALRMLSHSLPEIYMYNYKVEGCCLTSQIQKKNVFNISETWDLYDFSPFYRCCQCILGILRTVLYPYLG